MAGNEDDGAGNASKRRPQGVDLADIKAEVDAIKPSTANAQIAAAITVAQAARAEQFTHGEFSDTATGIFKRAMMESDPFGAAVGAAGVFPGGVAESAMREALNDDLVSRAAEGTITNSLAEQAIAEASRGSFVHRTTLEIVEAERTLSDLVLGRTAADTGLASAVRTAQGSNGQLDWGSHYATGRAAMMALEDTYASLGIGGDRERLLGTVAGVGSLARIAAGLIDHAGAMRLRASDMFVETQRRIDADTAMGTIGYALRAGYGDLFPAMRVPRASEIEAVIAESQSDNALLNLDWAAEARGRLEALTTPWVRSDLPDASIAAMARLSEVDRLVERVPPWEAELIQTLRARLGDYRNAPEPEPAALADPVARTGYQLDQGFDPVLTVLPTAVLVAMFAPFTSSDPAVPVDPDQLENAVRMLLKRLEHALRRFISAKLQAHYGADWFDRMPTEIRRSWAAGRQKDIDESRTPDELIAYADIDHYRRIIEHPDRWSAIFEPVFKDQAAIRETLRRIAVIRNPGAHFRAVTVEDLIILRAEGAHLAKWLGIRLGG